MRRKTKQFLDRAINSLLLSIELFNRPYENGRVESVFIILDHAFEMLMKAIIYEKTGKIRGRREKYNYGFKKCVNILKDDLHIIDENSAITLNTINDLRDNAVHHIIILTEEALYFHCQAGVTLFNELLKQQFDTLLKDYLPERVLPISTNPPTDINVFFGKQFSEIYELISPGRKKKAEARARLRPFMVLENNINNKETPTVDYEADKILNQMKEGKEWKELFPGIASLKMDSSGSGLTYSLRLTKGEGIPVRLLKEGEDTSKAMVIREVNLLDCYSLNITQVAKKLGITRPKTCALVEYLKIQDDKNYFKEFKIGSQKYKRYDPRVISYLQKERGKLDIHDVWKKYKERHYERK